MAAHFSECIQWWKVHLHWRFTMSSMTITLSFLFNNIFRIADIIHIPYNAHTYEQHSCIRYQLENWFATDASLMNFLFGERYDCDFPQKHYNYQWIRNFRWEQTMAQTTMIFDIYLDDNQQKAINFEWVKQNMKDDCKTQWISLNLLTVDSENKFPVCWEWRMTLSMLVQCSYWSK
jgi:hypothetical protein